MTSESPASACSRAVTFTVSPSALKCSSPSASGVISTGPVFTATRARSSMP
jgi:hypothetical protein